MKNIQDSFFAEPIDPRKEARELALEVICRLLLWMADAPTASECGLRTSVALYCIRPDFMAGATLEKLGERVGCTRQAVHALAANFRATTGLKS